MLRVMAAAAAARNLSWGLSLGGPGRTLLPGRRHLTAAGDGVWSPERGQEEEREEEPTLAVPPVPSRRYRPPPALDVMVRAVLERATGSPAPGDWREARLGEAQRFRLLRGLAQELGRPVPNSQLHQMVSAGDLLRFYRQPADPDTSSFQELGRSALPPNLRIKWGYEESRAGGDWSKPS